MIRYFRTLAMLIAFGAASPSVGAVEGVPIACGCGHPLPCPYHRAPDRVTVPPPQRTWPGPTQPTRPVRRTYPNVISVGNNRYRPAPGYMWVTDDPNDLRVVRIPAPGTRHHTYPNIIWGQNGKLRPAEGYLFVNPSDPKDLRVRRIPAGTPHGRYPHVVWGKDGKLWPAEGYAWDPNNRGSFRVVPIVFEVDTTLQDRETMLRTHEAKQLMMRKFRDAGNRHLRAGDLEKARDSLERALNVSAYSSDSGIRDSLRTIERRLADRERNRKSRDLKKLMTSDSLVRIRVPSPLETQRRFVRSRSDVPDWSGDVNPIVAVGSKALDKLLDKAAAEAKVKMEQGVRKLADSVPGLSQYLAAKEQWEQMDEEIGKPRRRLLFFLMGAIGRAPQSVIYHDEFEAEYAERLEKRFEEDDSYYRGLVRKKVLPWLPSKD